VLAALVILAVLTVQGLAILLPVNLLVYFELRKPEPDVARVGRLMRPLCPGRRAARGDAGRDITEK